MRVAIIRIFIGVIVTERRELVCVYRAANSAKLGFRTAKKTGGLGNCFALLPYVLLVNRLGAS